MKVKERDATKRDSKVESKDGASSKVIHSSFYDFEPAKDRSYQLIGVARKRAKF